MGIGKAISQPLVEEAWGHTCPVSPVADPEFPRWQTPPQKNWTRNVGARVPGAHWIQQVKRNCKFIPGAFPTEQLPVFAPCESAPLPPAT